MFVPWLELAALAERDVPDINKTGFPVGRNDDGMYFWQPGEDGSLVIAQHGDPCVNVHELGAALADRATTLGVNVLRPEWEGGNPSTADIEEWVGAAVDILEERWSDPAVDETPFFQPPFEPVVVLVPHYENTYTGHYELSPVNRAVGKLVEDGGAVGMYSLVTYRINSGAAALGDPESFSNNLFSPYNSTMTVMDSTLYLDLWEDKAAVLTRHHFEHRAAGWREVDLLPLDQIARGSWE